MTIRCCARIPLSKYAETYCMLESGHKGSHSEGDITALRCDSVSPHGVQCGQPKGHKLQHSNGLLTPISWSDKDVKKD